MNYIETKLPNLEFTEQANLNDLFYSGLDRMARLDQLMALLNSSGASNSREREIYYLDELRLTLTMRRDYLKNMEIAERTVSATGNPELLAILEKASKQGNPEWDPTTKFPYAEGDPVTSRIITVSATHGQFRSGEQLAFLKGVWFRVVN